MGTAERAFDRGLRRGNRLRAAIGDELRDARLSHGLSQRVVAAAARMSGPKLSRIERGRCEKLAISDVALVAAVVGLDLNVRTFPGGVPIRDAPQASRLSALLRGAGPPLVSRVEVPLPARDGISEKRAWDATLDDGVQVMGIEYEVKLYDVQAQARRFELKVRDGGLDRALLVIADTRANRRVLREYPEYFANQPRVPARLVSQSLAAGQLPPGGVTLL